MSSARAARFLPTRLRSFSFSPDHSENLYLRFLPGSKQIDEVLNGLVSLGVSRFDFAEWFRGLLRAVVKQAVGERATNSLVEEDEQGGHPDAFCGESVAVGAAGAVPTGVGFHLTQVIAELGGGIGFWGEREGAENRFMDQGRPPTVELRAAVQQHSTRRIKRVSWILMPGRDAGGTAMPN